MNLMKSSLALVACSMVAMCTPAYADVQIDTIELGQLDVGQSLTLLAVRNIEPVASFDAYKLTIDRLDAISFQRESLSPNPAVIDRHVRYRSLHTVQAGLAFKKMHQHDVFRSHSKTEIGWLNS